MARKPGKTVLRISDIQVNATGESVRISLSSECGDSRDLLILTSKLGELIDSLIRVHLDANVAKAAPPREWEVEEEFRDPATVIHVTDIDVAKWDEGGAAFRLKTVEGQELVAAFMPDKIRFLRETLRQHFDGPGQPADSDDSPPPQILPMYPGQAPDQDEFRLKNGSGCDIDPTTVTFPIIRAAPGNTYDFVGTGFFVAPEGVFATARHVLDDLKGVRLPSESTLMGLHFLENDQYVLRPIVNYTVHDLADVGIGKLADASKPDGTRLRNDQLVLSAIPPSVGDRVFTYAYPNTTQAASLMKFNPRFYHGTLDEAYPDGRDKHLMPGPCCRTSMVVDGGASGGPVFGENGRVFGVNSTGFEQTRLSFVSRISELLELKLDQVRLSETEEPRTVSMQELADKGLVILR